MIPAWVYTDLLPVVPSQRRPGRIFGSSGFDGRGRVVVRGIEISSAGIRPHGRSVRLSSAVFG